MFLRLLEIGLTRGVGQSESFLDVETREAP